MGPDIRNRIGSDAAKLFVGPVGKVVADNAMQVMGGAGYCREHPLERLLRDAKLMNCGGTLESHQKNLSRTFPPICGLILPETNMAIGKRIILFVLTNILVLVLVGIVFRLVGLRYYTASGGLDLTALLVFSDSASRARSSL